VNKDKVKDDVKDEYRQAVLLIHGIGEQRPMETLSGFVDALLPKIMDTDDKDHKSGRVYWSKPNRLTNSYELRRFTTKPDKNGIRTDFFEFYWAHLMDGTTVSHVIFWLKNLLIRRPSSVPEQLKTAYIALWALIPATILIAAYIYFYFERPKWYPIIPFIALPFVYYFIQNIIGDAARYLDQTPLNVGRRQEIREKGVELLKKIHEKSKYNRIIVVGHSLGSVIGYDILQYMWADFHRFKGEEKESTARKELEKFARELDDKKKSYHKENDSKKSDDEKYAEALEIADATQKKQHDYFNELQKNGCEWKITDFITLGSPLAHSEILLAKNREDLVEKQNKREVATCPPYLEIKSKPPERVFTYSYPFEEDASDDRSNDYHNVPHHAAVFGPTRWSNLYFESSFVVKGDIIGGPIGKVLGPGIKDIRVTTEPGSGLFKHTCYWKPDSKNDHIEKLYQLLFPEVKN